MNRPCQYAITCPGNDLPFLNASSEALDTLDYLGFGFAYGPGGNIPPMQQDWTLTACGVALFHSTSPIDAQLQAIADAIICDSLQRYPDNPIIPSNPQICCQPTPTGENCFTIVDGVIGGQTQAGADQRAHALACYFSRRTFGRSFRLNTPANGCRGVAYLQDLTPSGGVPPYVIEIVAGTLPPGVVFHQEDPRFGTLDGLPNTSGNFTFTVQVQDVAGNMLLIQDVTIGVLAITNPTLPSGAVGTPYAENLIPAGGTGPYSFVANSGLPNGLSMDSSGFISGTPTLVEDVFFPVTVTDVNGNSCQVMCELNVQGCVNWSAMTWSAPSFSGAQTHTFGPGASFSVSAGATAGQVANAVGSVNYTGPGCNAKVTGFFSWSGNFNGGFKIYQDGNLLLDFNVGIEPIGNFTKFFTVAPGVNSVITVLGRYNFIGAQYAYTSGGGTIVLSGTLATV